MNKSNKQKFHYFLYCRFAYGFDYSLSKGMCWSVRQPAVIWFIETVWQATEPWRTRSSVFPMIWVWAYFFLLRSAKPLAACALGPRMSNSVGQLNNNIHTVFTHLGLHFLTGGMETLITIQICARNHTKFHLQLMQWPWSATMLERFLQRKQSANGIYNEKATNWFSHLQEFNLSSLKYFLKLEWHHIK